MPWQKGVATPGAGRKGYEFEEAQLKRMNAVFNGVIELSEKVLKGKDTKKDREAIELIKPLAMKFCDKFHANKIILGNDHSNPFNIQVVKYADNNNSLPVQSPKLSTGNVEGPPKI
jgi:hypothetical protein